LCDIIRILASYSISCFLASEFLSIHPAPEEEEEVGSPPPKKTRNKVSFVATSCKNYQL